MHYIIPNRLLQRKKMPSYPIGKNIICHDFIAQYARIILVNGRVNTVCLLHKQPEYCLVERDRGSMTSCDKPTNGGNQPPTSRPGTGAKTCFNKRSKQECAPLSLSARVILAVCAVWRHPPIKQMLFRHIVRQTQRQIII